MIISKFLNKLNIDLSSFNDVFLAHPEYPSMLAVTDTLNSLNIENIFASVPINHINQLPNIFLVEILDPELKFVIVEKLNDEKFKIHFEDNSKKLNRDELEKIWNKKILIVENTISKYKGLIFTKNELIISMIFIFLAIISYNNLFFVLSTYIGLLISIELIKINVFKMPNWSSKICELSKDFSCATVAKYSKTGLLENVHFYDFPLLYFITITILLVVRIPIDTIILFSFFALPILFYSVYKQYFEIKKWCILCLMTSLIVILNISWFLFKNEKINFFDFDFITIAIIVILVFVWYNLKNVFLSNQNLKQDNIKLNRFVKSENVFYRVSEKLDSNQNFNHLDFITIGDATLNELVLFITSSCPHCHTAILSALNLYNSFSDKLCIKIGYNSNTNSSENPYLKVALIITQLYQNGEDFLSELKLWHEQKIELNDFANKWKHLKIDENTTNILHKHYDYCSSNGWDYAPIRILNGNLIESHYDTNDLHYYFFE
jgi:hypothetical protein